MLALRVCMRCTRSYGMCPLDSALLEIHRFNQEHLTRIKHEVRDHVETMKKTVMNGEASS